MVLEFVTVPPPVRPANVEPCLFSNVPPVWTFRVALLKRIRAFAEAKPPLAILSVPAKLVAAVLLSRTPLPVAPPWTVIVLLPD